MVDSETCERVYYYGPPENAKFPHPIEGEKVEWFPAVVAVCGREGGRAMQGRHELSR